MGSGVDGVGEGGGSVGGDGGGFSAGYGGTYASLITYRPPRRSSW